MRTGSRRSVRIVQVANFYGPRSGGLRTTVDMLGQGYGAAGLDRVLVVPGPATADEQTPFGRRITLAAPAVPGGGGYRFFPDWLRVATLLSELGPDRLEVSDKLTLGPLGTWAQRRGVPAVLLSHERLDAILAPRLPRRAGSALAWAADRHNRRLAAAFPTVVAASDFSCVEWRRIGADNVIRVPLGVDLETFRPPRPSAHPAVPGPAHRSLLGPPHPSLLGAAYPAVPGPAHLVCVGRLSKEKRPDLAVAALRELLKAGVAARLTLAGAGPERDRLARQARRQRLPVEFTGHLSDRREVARLLAGADVVLAPCPVEAFGLAVLEGLACGTPVVTTDEGAAPELLSTGCGATAPPRPAAMAAAAAMVLEWRRESTRIAARRRAEQFPWSKTVAAMLAAHQLPAPLDVGQCG